MAGRKKWMIGSPDGRAVAAMLLAVLFAVSGVVGCIAAGLIRDPDAELSECLTGYLALAAEGALKPGFWGVLWRSVQFAVIAVVLGSTPLGVVGIPLLVLFQGFGSCYAVSAFYRVFGLFGLVFALILFGLSAFLWLPVLLELGVRGLVGACGLLRRAMGEGRCPSGDHGGPVRYGVCVLALLGCVGVEYLLVPRLLQQIAGAFLAG